MAYGYPNQNLATSMAMKRLLGIGAANQPYPNFNFAGGGATLPQESPIGLIGKTPGAWLPQESPIMPPEGRVPRPVNTLPTDNFTQMAPEGWTPRPMNMNPTDLVPEGRVPRQMGAGTADFTPEGRTPRPMPTQQAGPNNQNAMRRGVKNPMFLF